MIIEWEVISLNTIAFIKIKPISRMLTKHNFEK